MKCLVVFACLLCTTYAARVDRTLEVDARGADTVRSAISRLDSANLFESTAISTQKAQVYEQFTRELSYVESEDGEANTDDSSTDGGIWRVGERIFEETQSYDYRNLYQLICNMFCIDWSTVTYRDLANPLISGLTVQIYVYHLELTGRGLSESATDRQKAAFWLEEFRGNQGQLINKWLRRVAQLRMIEVCRVSTDVVFVLDSSGSIGRNNYQLVRDYTYNFTESLLANNTRNRVGIILYGDSARVEVDLDYLAYNSTENLLDRITNLEYLSEYTNTPEGLCLLKTMNWRDSISTLRLAVVLTDGQSNRESKNCSNGTNTLETVAREIHERTPQIVVSAVGVANFVLSELQLIATSNSSVDQITEFDPNLLEQNQYYRSYSACFKVVQQVANNAITEGTADRGSVSRLQFSGSVTEGVSIRICIEEGGIVIYGSYSNPNPGAAFHDFSENLDSTSSQCLTSHVDQSTISRSETCSSCEIDNIIRSKRQIEDVEMINVYITIEGSIDGSRFSVTSEEGRSLVADTFQHGCLGKPSLCDSDATVVCEMNGTAPLLCECVYVSGSLNLPTCEDQVQQQPPSNDAFIALVVVAAVICVGGSAIVVIVAGVVVLNSQKKKKKRRGHSSSSHQMTITQSHKGTETRPEETFPQEGAKEMSDTEPKPEEEIMPNDQEKPARETGNTMSNDLDIRS